MLCNVSSIIFHSYQLVFYFLLCLHTCFYFTLTDEMARWKSNLRTCSKSLIMKGASTKHVISNLLLVCLKILLKKIINKGVASMSQPLPYMSHDGCCLFLYFFLNLTVLFVMPVCMLKLSISIVRFVLII